jgi:protein-disulfide isomerase
MKTLNRRDLLLGTTAAAAVALFAAPAFAQGVDLAQLYKEPELGDMWLGNKDAKVTVIEYASASCPHCAKFHNEVYGQFKAEYIDTGKIRFIFREFPLNDAALAAFMIARSAPKEAYFPLMDIYFTTLETWAADPAKQLPEIAKQAGIGKEKFDAIMQDKDLVKKIIAIRDDGTKFGVTGTPTFFINGEMLDGEQSLDALKAKIDPLLG